MSVPVGLLAVALLVVNNLRDIPGDTASGKRTLAVRLGDQRTRILYTALMFLPFVSCRSSPGWVTDPSPPRRCSWWCSLNKPVLKVLQGAKGLALIPVLGATGRVQLLFGLVFAAGLFVGG